MTRSAIVLLGSVLLASCGTATATHDVGAGADRTPAHDPIVEVENGHWLPMKIHLVSSGMRYFLGEVQADATGAFRIPRDMVRSGSVRLLIDPRGAAAEYVTEPVLLGNGRHIRLRVGRILASSRVHIL